MAYSSIDVGRAALKLALTETRDEENNLRKQYTDLGFLCVAVDFGGRFIDIIPKVMEHAAVAAQRQGVVKDTHVEKGAVVGATEQALEQLKLKCLGLNVGGKLGIARYNEHLSVAIYLGVGVLNLNEIAVAAAHRSLPHWEL